MSYAKGARLGADCLVALRRQGDESQGRVYSNANNLA